MRRTVREASDNRGRVRPLASGTRLIVDSVTATKARRRIGRPRRCGHAGEADNWAYSDSAPSDEQGQPMTMRRPWTATSVAVTLAALVTAACGSTVAGTRTASGVAGAALGGAAPGAAQGGSSTASGLGGSGAASQSGATVTTGGAASQAGSVGGPGVPSRGGAVSGGSTGAVQAGGGSASAVAPGVTATTIKVGVTYTANGEAANAALGASAITRGDEKGYMKAVIDDINERGGIAGRKLVPVYFAYDAQSAESKDAQDQAACAALTQDNHVFVAFGGGLTENFDACLQKAGVVKLGSGRLINEDAAYF